MAKNNESEGRQSPVDVVTGATGHIGNVLVRELLERGRRVRVLIHQSERENRALADLNVERAEGDVLQRETLERAFRGVRIVYHLAGVIDITTNKKALERMERVNVDGTRNVIAACRAAHVERLVYTSSIHAFVEPQTGERITEARTIDPERVVGAYAKTKAQATLDVERASHEGLDAVIVCPTGVIGPYDFNNSQTGQVFIDFASGKLKAYMKGEYNYVDVRDVAAGHILAADRGKNGERYILSGEQLTVKRMYNILASVTGRKAPTFLIQPWFATLTAPFAAAYYRMMKSKPLFTKYSVYTLTKSSARTTNAKAVRELGFRARPIEESIRDTVHWLEKNGMLIIQGDNTRAS